MPIPSSERVVFDVNPLVEVSCQFITSTVLRLEAEAPFQLQEQLREQYPFVQQAYQKLDGRSETLKVYEFISQDRFWKFSLSSRYIRLATTDYTDREEFQDRLQTLLSLYSSEYNQFDTIAFELNYRDVIDRRKLGLAERPWAYFLNPAFAGELADPEFQESSLLELKRSFALRLPAEQGRAEVTHGLHRIDEHTWGYVIDSSFGLEKTQSFQQVMANLDTYHDLGGSLFRWMISDELMAQLKGGASHEASI